MIVRFAVLDVWGKYVVVSCSRLVKPSWLNLSNKGTGCSVRRSLVEFVVIERDRRLSYLISLLASQFLVYLSWLLLRFRSLTSFWSAGVVSLCLVLFVGLCGLEFKNLSSVPDICLRKT